MKRAIVLFEAPQEKISVDLDIPLDISAYELVLALNTAYQLGIDTNDIKKCFFKAENPTALLRGGQSLAAFGIRDGSIIMHLE